MDRSAERKVRSTAGDVLRKSVLDELRRQILVGTLKSGEHIVERDVAEQFRSSRGPVRDAIRALESEGLVTVRPYAGASVVAADPSETDEIIEIRRQVEYFSMANAAFNVSPSLIKQLRHLASELGQALRDEDPGRLFQLDAEFHFAICGASGHATLGVLLKILLSRLHLLWYQSIVIQQHTPETFEEAHLTLVRALEEQDIDKCMSAVDEHLNGFYVDLKLQVVRTNKPSIPQAFSRPLARPVLAPRLRGA